MTYPMVWLVDAPTADAGVLYNFNDRQGTPERWIDKEGFTLGAPTLEGDPDAVGVTWGYRQPAFLHKIRGTKTAALAALSQLSRLLVGRRTSWLMVKLDADRAPVWLRVYRTGQEALRLDRVYVKTTDGGKAALSDTWQVPLAFTADPFGYGERVTLAPVTLSHDPSDPNLLRYVLPQLQGEAPTGLRVSVRPFSTSGVGRAAAWLHAAVSSDDDVFDPLIAIGSSDGFTAGAGTAAPASSSAYMNGSYRTVTVPGSTGNLAVRLSGPLPVTPPPGRYKVLLRCEADPVDSITANRYLFSLGQLVNNVYRYGETVSQDTPAPVAGRGVGAYAFQGWVDLGEFTFPWAVSIPADVLALQPVPDIALRIGTAEGTAGVVRIDGFKLIPIDGQEIRTSTVLKTSLESAINNYDSGVYALDNTLIANWDADSETYWAAKATSGTLVDGAPVLQGGFPLVDPAAAENVLISFPTARGRATGSAATSISGQWQIVLSYHPLFLHLGDGS